MVGTNDSLRKRARARDQNAADQRRLKARRKAAGIVRVEVYVHRDDKEELKRRVAVLNARRARG